MQRRLLRIRLMTDDYSTPLLTLLLTCFFPFEVIFFSFLSSPLAVLHYHDICKAPACPAHFTEARDSCSLLIQEKRLAIHQTISLFKIFLSIFLFQMELDAIGFTRRNSQLSQTNCPIYDSQEIMIL